MRALHPNLGLPATGRRKAVYITALAASGLFCGGAYLAVVAGLLPATPTDVYSSWITLFVLFVPFIALVDNDGESRTQVEKWAEFGFVWLLVSGLAQTFWELPWFFLDLTGIVRNASPDDRWLWLWWVYGGADTRYLTSNPTIAGCEFMAGLSGPFELLAWFLYTRGKTVERKITACWMALTIGVGLTYMTGVFFVSEWHLGWVHIQQGAMGFWLKFVGLNVPWIIAPFIALPGAVYELAHWYRVQGYEQALAELKVGRAVEPQPRRESAGVRGAVPVNAAV